MAQMVKALARHVVPAAPPAQTIVSSKRMSTAAGPLVPVNVTPATFMLSTVLKVWTRRVRAAFARKVHCSEVLQPGWLEGALLVVARVMHAPSEMTEQ